MVVDTYTSDGCESAGRRAWAWLHLVLIAATLSAFTLLLGSFFVGWLNPIKSPLRQLEAAGWWEVEATVDYVGINAIRPRRGFDTYLVVCSFDYEVGGTTYRGSNFAANPRQFGSRWAAEKFLADFTPGSKVMARVNPANPAESVLDSRLLSVDVEMLPFAGVLVVGAIGAWIGVCGLLVHAVMPTALNQLGVAREEDRLLVRLTPRGAMVATWPYSVAATGLVTFCMILGEWLGLYTLPAAMLLVAPFTGLLVGIGLVVWYLRRAWRRDRQLVVNLTHQSLLLPPTFRRMVHTGVSFVDIERIEVRALELAPFWLSGRGYRTRMNAVVVVDRSRHPWGGHVIAIRVSRAAATAISEQIAAMVKEHERPVSRSERQSCRVGGPSRPG